MRLSGVLVSSIAAAILGIHVFGCNDSSDDSGRCCEPSPKPACCMAYGGVNGAKGCAQACDGMPLPDDPGWTLIDDDGCKRWFNPNDTWANSGHGPEQGAVFCGSGPMDGGANADASDAGSDANDVDAGDAG